MEVKAISNIDIFDPRTRLTEEGQSLMRYLFGTNEGEIYMLAFHLDLLHLVTNIGQFNANEANAFVVVEFLASKLSPCSTIQYIDNGNFFYGSTRGDSYIIQLMSEN